MGYCKECVRIKGREYVATDRGKEVARKKTTKYYYKNRDKKLSYMKKYKSAHSKIKYALEIGHIPGTNIPFKEQECILKHLGDCTTGHIHFHHTNGYDNTYTGVWLCPRCHKEVHLGRITLGPINTIIIPELG